MTLPLALGPVRPVPLSAINPVAQLAAIGVLLPVLLVSGDLVTPSVVLAAELCLLPAAGLAAPRALLAEQQDEGRALVLVTHDAAVVTALADDVLALRSAGEPVTA